MISQANADVSPSQNDAKVSPRALLDSVNVKPSVRVTRLSRSCSSPAFEEKYDLNNGVVLGSGIAGTVCAATVRASGVQVAVKTVSLKSKDPSDIQQALAEVQNHMTMDHPHICRLLEVFEEPSQLRLVMERMKGPDLIVHLSRKGCYSERDASRLVRQMCSAVKYCHRHGVVHRDLKLDNFCLEDDSPNARVKLIDFGFSAAFPSVPMTHAVGTIYYVAPEVLRQRYDAKCDLWSLGVITYILLDGQAPFRGADDRATAKLICVGAYSFGHARWNHVSQLAKDFIASLLKVDVKTRLDAEAALQHPWLASSETNIQSPPVPLDAAVLQGMRKFMHSNALKRAVLRAVAPVATVDQVSRWADQFEAIDREGNGVVPVHVLARRLMELSDIPNSEAAELSAALALAECGDMVSYSAFLAACLCTHVKEKEPYLSQLFQRLDVDNDGRISVDDLSEALGNVINIDALRAELTCRELSYKEFRQIIAMPCIGPTALGLRELLGACGDLASLWKVNTRRTKAKTTLADDSGSINAARQENMAWRIMAKPLAGLEGSGASSPSEAKGPSFALALDACFFKGESNRSSFQAQGERIDLDFGGIDDEGSSKRKSDNCNNLDNSDLINRPLKSGYPLRHARTIDLVSEDSDMNAKASWKMASVEAREGDVDAVRRENMAWRRWNMEQGMYRCAFTGAAALTPAYLLA